MNYAEAIGIAADLCDKSGREDVARTLRDLPQYRIAANALAMRKKLAAAGIDLDELLAETKALNETGDVADMRVANAKLEMMNKVLKA